MRSKIYYFIIMMTLLFLLPTGCHKDDGDSARITPNESDISALRQQTETRLSTPCASGRKIQVLWETKKIIKGNVYAEFLVNDHKVIFSDGGKKYAINTAAYFFADKPNNAKYTYLIFINPDSTFHMDYKNLDIYNLKKIKFTGYIQFFDLCMNFVHSNYYEDGKLVRYKNKKNIKVGAVRH